MKVKELITALLECDMNCNVELKTINADKNGCPHLYNIIGVDPTPIGTYASKELSIQLLFKNYDFEKDQNDKQKCCSNCKFGDNDNAPICDECDYGNSKWEPKEEKDEDYVPLHRFYDQNGFECCQQTIVNAPTIIEADKEDQNELANTFRN